MSEHSFPQMIPDEPQHGTVFSDGSILLVRHSDGIEISIEKKGVRSGQFKILYPSGKLKVESYYLEGQLHGPSTFYSEEGKVLSTSLYDRGKKEGLATQNYLSGALYSQQQFLHGEWEGEQKYYYENGTIKSRLYFKNGRLEGKQVLFNKDGTVKYQYAAR